MFHIFFYFPQAMRMAWESQQMTLNELKTKLSDIASKKVL